MHDFPQTAAGAVTRIAEPADVASEVDAALDGRVLIFGSLPPAGRDLDLLARPPQEEALAGHLERAGFLNRGRSWARFRDCGADVVELVPAAAWTLPEAALQALFDEAVALGGLDHLARPAPHHALLILARRIGHGALEPKHRRRIEAALLEDPQAWGRARAHAAAWRARGRLRRLQRRFMRDRPGAAQAALARVAALRRLAHRPPPGTLVALSGLDGAGKSSQARHLTESLTRAGLDPVAVWTSVASQPEGVAGVKRVANLLLNSMASARRVPSGAPAPPPAASPADRANALRKRSGAVRFGWATLQGVTNAARQRRRTARHLRRGRVVICDRYVLDALVHLRYAYGRSPAARLQTALLRRIPPRPDLTYFLDLPASEATARKAEYRTADNERRARLYRELCASHGAIRLDATQPEAVICARIAGDVWTSRSGTAASAVRRPPGPRTRVRAPKPSALIVEDGLSRHVLAAARGLREAGWTVGVASPASGFSAASRAVSTWHHVVAAEADIDRFEADVNTAIADGGYEIVFGARDADVLALSRLRERLEALVPYPRDEAVVRAFDKLTLGEAAERAGIATPAPMPELPPQLSASGQVIVKARLHPTLERKGADARMEARIATTSGQRDRLVAEIVDRGGTPLIQEHLEGKLMSLAILLDPEGRVIARAQQEAERIYPLDAGVSVRAHTIAVDERLAARAQAMLAALDWIGLAQLQFIVPADGAPRLIDFNGRFYGSLALAIGAGANLPALWANAATGRPTARVDAVPGVSYQWLWSDLRRALAERRGGLARDLADTGRFALGARHSVWRLRDPAPAARYAVGSLARRLSRLV